MGRGVPIGVVVADSVPGAVGHAGVGRNVSIGVLAFGARGRALSGEVVGKYIRTGAISLCDADSAERIAELGEHGAGGAADHTIGVAEVPVGADGHTHVDGGVREVGVGTARVTLVEEGVAVGAGWALGQARAVGVGESAIWAVGHAFHGGIVDESVADSQASGYAGPVVGFVLDVVVVRAHIHAHLHVRVCVRKQLHSSNQGTVLHALPVERVAVLTGCAVLRPYALLVGTVNEGIVGTLGYATIFGHG